MSDLIKNMPELAEISWNIGRRMSREYVEAVKSGILNRRLQSIGTKGNKLREWSKGLDSISSIDVPVGLSEDWQTLSFHSDKTGFSFELSGVDESGLRSFPLIFHDIDGYSVAATEFGVLREVGLIDKILDDPVEVIRLAHMPVPLSRIE